MAYLSKKSVAEKCGVKMPAITAAIKTKKLVLMKDGKRINTANKLNSEYFLFHEKRLQDLKKEKEKKTNKKKPPIKKLPVKKTPVRKPKTKTPPADDAPPENKDGQLTIYDLNKIHKEKEIQLKEINIENKKLENRRLSGELIPVKYVKLIVKIQSKSFIESYQNNLESFIIQFIGQNKITPKKGAQIKKQLIDFINKSHDESITQAQQKMAEAFELSKQSK
jgi:hypothetical protein